MAWLVRDGEVLAAVEVAETARARRRGLHRTATGSTVRSCSGRAATSTPWA